MTATDTPRLGGEAQADGTIGYSSDAVMHLTGATYRQLTYWTNTGRLGGNRFVGSGRRRLYTPEQIDIVHAAVAMLAAGFTLDGALHVARVVSLGEPYQVTVGSIYEITIRVRPTLEGDPT